MLETLGFKRQSGEMKKIFDILDYESKIKYGVGDKINSIEGKIEFVDVSFSYPKSADIKVFDNINIVI